MFEATSEYTVARREGFFAITRNAPDAIVVFDGKV